MTKAQLLNRIITFYDDSADANGLLVRRLLLEKGVLPKVLRRQIIELEAHGNIEVVFAETDENPHIRRFPRNFRRPFTQLIETCRLEEACLYPSPEVIATRIDLSQWKTQPYTTQLWSGDSHLDIVYFDLAVLERYRNDPRYYYSQDFFGGSIHLHSEYDENDTFPERDKVFLERFGIGYDPDGHWVLGVILRDLIELTPEHQNLWKAYQRNEPCTLNEASFRTWFFGEWLDFSSGFAALIEEFKVINAMCEAAFRKTLFKQTFEDNLPKEYGVLLRPTEKEFLDFARSLDVMLSENIDKAFFPASLQRTFIETSKDGTEKVTEKGTVRLLQEWLESIFRAHDGDPAKEVTDPLKKVRSLRSKASHRQIKDVFDYKYEEEQRNLLKEVYGGVRTLRLVLANHPRTKNVEVSKWLFECDIRMV